MDRQLLRLRLRDLLLWAFGLLGLTGLSSRALAEDFDGEPILYSSAKVDDPVARLEAQLESGEATLRRDDAHGYLPSILEALDIPVSSQVLVFSKTSFQRDRISPAAPRAVYFNDDTYIGWVQGGTVVEVATLDPGIGTVFYALEQRPPKSGASPSFQRLQAECLQCHASPMTLSVPGLVVRSVYPDPEGMPILRGGTFTTTHASPFRERWGGWYVSGTHGAELHLGNVTAPDRDSPEALDIRKGANVVDLSTLINVKPYLSPHSDIVALMVLEHQAQLHNLIVSASYQARFALRDQAVLNRMMNEPPERLLESTERRFEHATMKLLRYMLFLDEAPFRGPIRGTSAFATEFAGRGPRDSKGRSLRDLDLSTRLLRHPLSYLIYSRSFWGMPRPLLDHVLVRLHEVLTEKDTSRDFAALTSAQRKAILEILLETLGDRLPASWKAEAEPAKPASRVRSL